MFERLQNFTTEHKRKLIFFLVALCLSIIIIGSVVQYGFIGPLIAVALAISISFFTAAFIKPKIIFWVYIAYCFVLGFVVKSFLDIPVGLALDALIILGWAGILVNMNKYEWKNLRNDHVLISLIWFGISLLQILNPYGGSITGWFNELRFTSLTWLCTAPLVFLIFNSNKDLKRFIALIFTLSIIATLYGMKQLYFGLSGGEQRWMDMGNDYTHMLKGELRVFSMYSDAGQFGASQAIVAVIAIVMTLGPFTVRYKILFGLTALILLYGLAISGTRGALFALVSGLLYAIFLSKKFKMLLLGVIFCIAGLGVLKFTTLGEEIFQIQRLRSALDPKDASLHVRFDNQKILVKMLEDYPFGAGLGMSGTNGLTYNSKFAIAKIPPDSYWVKIWVMYGVVGLVIWFGLNCYIIGKCSGIVWQLQDRKLKAKMMALTAGTLGCFICSYGNEVMNAMPSSIILYMSWSFVFMSPYLDKEILENSNGNII